MLDHFKCPDNIERPIKDCLTACPRKEGRCLSLPTLAEIGKVRPFSGTFSTTQLLKGCRQVYLEIKCPFSIDPMDTAFMLLGIRHHQKLDHSAKQLNLMSEQFLPAEISGISDLIEPDELHPGFHKLIDYKTAGSYVVAKALGRKSDSGETDMREWELQTNKYRIEIEKTGINISRIFIQACVRDGGTFSAKNNQVPEKFVMIPVKQLPNKEVMDYFNHKLAVLNAAMASNIMPPLCAYDERWGNRRCKGFCPVAKYCPEGAKINKLELIPV